MNATATKSDFFETKDKWSILALIAKGHIPADITVDTDSCGSTVLLYRFPSAAQPDFDNYNRGVPMEVDIHQIKNADHSFKANLHRLIGYRK